MTFDVRVHAHYDAGPGIPGTIIWEQLDVGVTTTSDGGVFRRELIIDPEDYFGLEAGTTYWFSIHSNISQGSVWLCFWYHDTHAVSTNGGTAWSVPNNTMLLRINGTEDLDAPEVSGQVPADGTSGIAVNSDIVFHVTDDCTGVDTTTISFAVEDSAKSGETTASLTDRGSTGAITGTLVVDDTDPCDVICTFTPDSDLPPDTITCTVASGLADDYGRATTTDIVWSFDTTGSAVEETTWGQIKAL